MNKDSFEDQNASNMHNDILKQEPLVSVED